MGEWQGEALVAAALGLIVGAALCCLAVALARTRKPSFAVGRGAFTDRHGPGHAARAESGDSGPDLREAILHALARAARLLFNARDKEDAMTSALATLGEAVGADRVYVFKNHREECSGRLLASQQYEWCGPGVNPEIDNPAMQDMSYDEALPNWTPVLSSGRAVRGLVREMPLAERELLSAQDIVSIAVVPIFLDGAFWGMIGFDDCSRERQWTQAELDALEIAAGAIGGAIRGIEVEQELHRMVSTDSLTGVSSRRSFLKCARDAFEEAVKDDESLALLIMDLDHFKAVNDNHGHPVGDEALKLFARVCRSTVRNDDIIGRTGGEEFAVALLGADRERALALAENLRRRVESTLVPVETGEGVALTVSIGVATLDDERADFGRLLKLADDSLYRAKKAGRNRVVAWCQRA